mmetsp:Transcript_68466/g.121570  ORF Transcript_68466/g.121570 Transcript_68466/m.121570 type:complete len:154 (-) Transcript_68466:63-524(-)
MGMGRRVPASVKQRQARERREARARAEARRLANERERAEAARREAAEKAAAAAEREELIKLREAAAKAEPVMKRLLKIFDQFDKDATGTISVEELTRVLQKLDPERFTAEECDAVFAAADANDDGLVDYEEFCEWLLEETPAPMNELMQASGE